MLLVLFTVTASDVAANLLARMRHVFKLPGRCAGLPKQSYVSPTAKCTIKWATRAPKMRGFFRLCRAVCGKPPKACRVTGVTFMTESVVNYDVRCEGRVTLGEVLAPFWAPGVLILIECWSSHRGYERLGVVMAIFSICVADFVYRHGPRRGSEHSDTHETRV